MVSLLSRAFLLLNNCRPRGCPLSMNDGIPIPIKLKNKISAQNHPQIQMSKEAGLPVAGGLLCLRCLSISGLTAAADRVMPFCVGPNTPQNGACSPGSLWLTITNRGHNILHRTHQSSPPAAANTQPFQVSCYYI